MGAVKHAVRVVDGGGFAVPLGRQRRWSWAMSTSAWSARAPCIAEDPDLLRRDRWAVSPLAGG